MQAFKNFSGLVAPIERPNVDTDAIIPKQYLKSIKRSGFGPNLFDEERYLDPGQADSDSAARRLNPDFVLNQARYQGAEILLTRENFGCGSSREHAVWALEDFGIRCIIGSSFADIFFSNAFKNGLLLVTLPEADIDALFEQVKASEGYRLAVDLQQQQVQTPDGQVLAFDVNADSKNRLLKGLDDIAITLQHSEAIRDYERRQKAVTPWLFADR